MEYHAAANIFPIADSRTIQNMAESIRKNGQMYEIDVFKGKILDGRCRYLACKIAGVEPRYVKVSPLDCVQHVIDRNILRRHLNTGQRAIAAGRAVKLSNKYRREGLKAMEEGQKSGGRGKKKTLGPNYPRVSRTPRSRDKLGETFGVSGRSAERGVNIVTKGMPELAEAVLEGKLSLQKGEEITRLTPHEKGDELSTENVKVQQEALQKAITASKPSKPKPTEQEGEKEKKDHKGAKGMMRAHEAIDCLMRIPQNDSQREMGFAYVAEWIRRNKTKKRGRTNG